MLRGRVAPPLRSSLTMDDERTSRDGAELPGDVAGPAVVTMPADSAGARVDELIAAVGRLERFASEESKRLARGAVPQLEAHAREHLWTSLLVALGLGMIVGLWLSGARRGA